MDHVAWRRRLGSDILARAVASITPIVGPEQLRTLVAFRRALSRDEVVVFFQPKVDLSTRETVAVEALVRWRHPDRGLLAPSEFLPHVTGTMFATELTLFVLAAAAEAQVRLALSAPELVMQVNLAARDLEDPRLPERVAEVLEDHGCPSHRICFEVTENDLLKNVDRATRTVCELSRAGAAIALDDFGTGYSSLARLQDMPVDEVKIDRSFVQRMSTDHGAASIVRAIIDLTHDLGAAVVAEGVEDEEQAARLHGLGCDQGQGYFFARPMALEEAAAWVRAKPLPAAAR